MKIDETTDAFWVLYLINVLQPIGVEELEAESRRLMKAAGRSTATDFNISRTLASLVDANMAISEIDGRYAVTVVGLQKLSLFHFGFSRDKNRMFVLKDRFRK